MSTIIKSDQLIVDIGVPGAYNGSRFDWTGFIQQVTLISGNHTFCAPESLIQGSGTGGIGLCNEFGIHIPVGYDALPVGECFPKVGVGLLSRTDTESYDFFKSYPVQPYPIHVENGPDYVRYVSDPIPYNGYAFKYVKDVRVHGATITIDYTLHNVGEKPIVTNEYVHNFLAINEQPIGPEYVLTFPYPVTPFQSEMSEYTQSLLHFDGQQMSLNKQVDDMFHSRVAGFDHVTPYYWQLIHQPSGIGLRERGSAPTSFIAFWGVGHVISPEVFIDISVMPGKTQQWSRHYDFFA